MYISRAGLGKTSVGINRTICSLTFTYNLGRVPKKNILKLDSFVLVIFSILVMVGCLANFLTRIMWYFNHYCRLECQGSTVSLKNDHWKYTQLFFGQI